MDVTTETIAVETQMRVEVLLPAVGAAFHAVLVREDIQWFDDDPTPDIQQYVVCERDLSVALPSVFAAIDAWLEHEHRLRVLPHSWQPAESGADTGVALLLEGRAAPALPIRGLLGNWG
ncbi:hypothetical protein H7I87_02765 [Mycobacterium timonense]|uniref:Uncharacterized protein n=2 Tax=Mycobacterium avium complex (MAC) TaxID=120793 RepID=A0AAW5SA31_MYCBC|nr:MULTISPECIES: hypothetical protein [Mycobacterium avium complex (MAC)]MCV6991830.1 hypothetical protein [Mycobacterium bouchedurhonense]MCV6993651.1 hypothetical protein [Mycobacterium timonense]MDV3307034.1 hypothetical protein [Mycobacterium avium subsp. hominissuis]ORA45768.1 hypothetical protein BST19_19925 [Mycobacterium bouchedurhonense]ORB77168.1 hypothetical protein BST46_26035 [Mycobacterium timonense]